MSEETPKVIHPPVELPAQESKEKAEVDPYSNSKALQMLSEGKRDMAILDIDSTLTGTPEQQEDVRKKLEAEGKIVMFVSSRVYEMMMSKGQREMSQIDNLRPVPKLKTGEEVHVIDDVRETVKVFQPAHPDELASFTGLLDGEISIDGTGSNVLLQQREGGYVRDQDFADQLRTESGPWRASTLQIVEQIQTEVIQDKLQNIDTMAQSPVVSIHTKDDG